MVNFKTFAAISAVVLLAGCGSNERLDTLEQNVATLQAKAILAETANAKALETANEAVEQAHEATKTANDAVEAVSRMAEKCCRK